MPDQPPGAFEPSKPLAVSGRSERSGPRLLACVKRLAPRRAWRRFKAWDKKAQRLDEAPDERAVNLTRYMSMVCAWSAKLNGAGVVASIAFMIASYVLLTEDCKVARFVSDTLTGAGTLSAAFGAGGTVGVLGANLPGLIGLWRNFKYTTRLLRRPQAVPVENELSDLKRSRVVKVSFGQLLAAMISLILFLSTLGSLLAYSFLQTPEGLRRYRERHVEVCKPPPMPQLPLSAGQARESVSP